LFYATILINLHTYIPSLSATGRTVAEI